MVGVSIVREIFGVMHAERATESVVVTSGAFSTDATAFASGKPIRLIDGPALEKLVHSVRTTTVSPATEPIPASTTLLCPNCGAAMVKRTARKGKSVGAEFWGCPKFPECRGVRQVA